jgi:hypothetical protein
VTSGSVVVKGETVAVCCGLGLPLASGLYVTTSSIDINSKLMDANDIGLFFPFISFHPYVSVLNVSYDLI